MLNAFKVPCSALKGETVPDSLPATPKSPPTRRQGSRLPGPQERLGGPAHGPEDHRACTDPQGGDALLGMKKISLGFIIFSIYYLCCVNLTMRSGNLEWNSETRRPNQPILMKISPGVFLEGMMLKLKLQYFGHLMGRILQ